ncbi:MAG: hypothetical protein JW902_02325 [Syntrophaceae bacterium]|nr:hypothetical protein [Syntrophaceae bacterium]
MEETKKKVRQKDDYLVWFDTEYSGLELETAHLLQVAVMITDKSLCRILPAETDVRLAIQLPKEAIISPWVEENLSDLVTICCSTQAVTLEEADLLLARHIDTIAGPPDEHEARRPILAGNSVHADWWLSKKYLPLFSQRLHYRHLDVTALKLEWQNRFPGREFNKEDPAMIRQYFPEAHLDAGETRHDAYYDIQASIAELAFYRRHFLQYV